MTHFWMFPIEPLEERYSAQWMRWWPDELDRLDVEYTMVRGGLVSSRINKGEFLDTVGTHVWKAQQLVEFCEAIQAGEVKNGDWVVLHDGWSPMLESLAYIRDTEGPRFKIAGLMHAGTWDPHDYLSRKLGVWANQAQCGWFNALDAVFVATHFHSALIHQHYPLAKTHVTGFPFYPREIMHYAQPIEQRERLVVFPHRLAPEKQPEVFSIVENLYKARYPGDPAQWIRTKDVCKSKEDYYRLLGRARVAFSSALQETWGIAMLEASALGCWPVAPHRLSYPETLGRGVLYEDLDQAVELVYRGLDSWAINTRVMDYDLAIERMVRVMAVGAM